MAANLIDPDKGNFDLGALARTVIDANGRSDRGLAEFELGKASAAALVDIAASLRSIAASLEVPAGIIETVDVPPTEGAFDNLPTELGVNIAEQFAQGRRDPVTVDTPAGSIVGITYTPEGQTQRTGVLLDESGVSEGLPWVAVRFYDTNIKERAFIANLEVIAPLDEGDEVKEDEGILDAPDGLDEDFGQPDVDAEQATAELKARSKAAKKKGGKS